MTYSEEQELLQLTRWNNNLLNIIVQIVLHNANDDFIQNVIANIVSNRIDPQNYAQKQY